MAYLLVALSVARAEKKKKDDKGLLLLLIMTFLLAKLCIYGFYGHVSGLSSVVVTDQTMMQCGAPQGSTLGPLLLFFSLYMILQPCQTLYVQYNVQML